MTRIKNYTVCAFVASMLAILAWPQVSSAQANVTIVPSPYGVTTPVADAADKFLPIAGDAKWDHEVCVIAYRYAYELEALPERIAARLEEFDENTAGRISRGMSRDEITRARAETVDSLAKDERAFRAKAARNMRNIPKCKGTFYRPAIEAQCRKIDHTQNRFCAILDGKELDGVRDLRSGVVSQGSGLELYRSNQGSRRCHGAFRMVGRCLGARQQRTPYLRRNHGPAGGRHMDARRHP